MNKSSQKLKNRNSMLKVGFSITSFRDHLMLNVFSVLLHVALCFVINIAWKLVENNVYVKPSEGPSSNGHHGEKDEKKPEEEKEAKSNEGNFREMCQRDELMHLVEFYREALFISSIDYVFVFLQNFFILTFMISQNEKSCWYKFSRSFPTQLWEW